MTDRHQAPSYPLRMPPELKERMVLAAKESGRSLHAELVARLQSSFDAPKLGFGPGSVGEQLQKARDELDDARGKMVGSSSAIADKILDLMQERGLVVTREVAESMRKAPSRKNANK